MPPTPIWAVLSLPFFVSAQTDEDNKVTELNAVTFFIKSLLFMYEKLAGRPKTEDENLSLPTECL